MINKLSALVGRRLVPLKMTFGFAALLALGLVSGSSTVQLWAQATSVAPETAQAPAPQRKTSEPYTGDLSVFDRRGRDKRLQIERVMNILAIAPGKTVADIGAGSGWFTVRAARRVTSSGRVLAVDINPDALRYIDARAAREKLTNVHTVQGSGDNPNLPPASVDAVLILKTYHEIASPVPLLEHLVTSLKPGARVGIIDRNGNGEDHGINKDVVIREASQAGFHVVGDYDFVRPDGEDYFLVLEAAIVRD